jgi:hypothetical protein
MDRTSPTEATRTPAELVRHLATVTVVVLLALFSATAPARADVGLGAADGFAILSGQSVANTGPTTITGDIGIHPGAADANLTGGASITLNGTLYDRDAEGVALAAKAALVTAYDDAAGRAVTQTIAPELDGADLIPGVYQSTGAGLFQLAVDGVLTLRGGPDDVWIFKSTDTLIFASGSQVVLAGGADPCNVYWQVASSATLGTDSEIVGTIMALTSISLETRAELTGRALARNGSVTMDSNTISNATCTTLTATDDTTDDTTDETPAPEEAAPTEQVPEVPTGPVAAGDGGSSTSSNWIIAAFAAVLAGLAIGGWRIRATRQRRAS